MIEKATKSEGNMEPQNSQPMVQPEPQNQLPNEPQIQQSMHPNSKKKLFIIIGCLIALIIICMIAMFSSQDKNSGTPQRDSSFYYNHDGFSADDKSIGDPKALDISKTGPVVDTGGFGPVVYACNLLSFEDLNKVGLYDPRADENGLTQTSMDKVGTIQPHTEVSGLPIGEDSNSCNMSIKGGLLELSVYQLPYIGGGLVTKNLENYYTKTGDTMNGFDIYKKSDKDQNQFMFKSDKIGANVYFGSAGDDKQIKSILNTITGNLKKLQTSPKGPAQPVYNSPTYKKQYARACDYISNDDIKALTGYDASTYTDEGLGNATGVAQVNGKLYTSIMTKCSRYNTGLGSGLEASGPYNQKLELTIYSYSDTPPAKLFMSQGAQGSEQTKLPLGDEAVAYRDVTGNYAVTIRSGRFVFDIMLNRTIQGKTGLQSVDGYVQKLTPYIQQLIAKLKAKE